MIAFVVFCVLVAGTLGQHQHSCIHNNHQALKEDQVIGLVLADMDKDGDGNVTVEEVSHEFVTIYDMNGDGGVDEDEFMRTWHAKYHDNHAFAGYLFSHFDTDGNGKLDAADLDALEAMVDANHDGTDTEGEFRAFMTNLYKNCVPVHGHGHNGK